MAVIRKNKRNAIGNSKKVVHPWLNRMFQRTFLIVVPFVPSLLPPHFLSFQGKLWINSRQLQFWTIELFLLANFRYLNDNVFILCMAMFLYIKLLLIQ